MLETNVLEWQGKLWQQVFGTAIGTPLAPDYSGLFMGELETKAFHEWKRLRPEKEEQLQFFKRMIDDGFGLWNGSLELLFEFLAFMNSQCLYISFTMEVTCLPGCVREDDHKCSQRLNFLDTSIWVDEEGVLQTDKYTKPNMKVQYLLPTSAHPKHCFPGITKSLTLRVARICSRPEDRDKRLEEQKNMLLSRGYNRRMVETKIEEAKQLDRTTLLEKVVRREGEDRVRYITTYDPRLPAISSILRKSWTTMLERDPRLRTAFPHPSQACYRQGPNLTSLLIRERLPRPAVAATRAVRGAREVGVRCCGKGGRRQGCRLCNHMGTASNMKTVVKEVVILHSGEVIQIKDNLDCCSESILYLITCTKQSCRKQYIGETGRTAYKRYTEHEDSAKDVNTTKEVGKHFQLPGHSTSDIEMVPIERVRGGRVARKVRERALIRQHQMVSFDMNSQS